MLLAAAAEMSIESRRKAVPVAGTELGGSAGGQSGRPQVLHEVSHRQPFADVLGGVGIAARVDGAGRLGHHLRGQGNIGGDDQVARRHLVRYGVVGRIEARSHPDHRDQRRFRYRQRPVGHHHHFDSEPLRSPIDDFLDGFRAGIRVDPNFHAAGSYPVPSQPVNYREIKVAASRCLVYQSHCFSAHGYITTGKECN